MNTRLLFALAAGIGCGIVGMRQAARLRIRHRMLTDWTEHTRRMEIHLAQDGLPLPDALTRTAQGDGAAAQVLRAAAEIMRHDPRKTAGDALRMQHGKHRAWETEDDRKTLERLMDGISHGTLVLRLKAAQQSGALLALAEKAAADKASRDAKLYVTLGWTAGVCLAILLL